MKTVKTILRWVIGAPIIAVGLVFFWPFALSFWLFEEYGDFALFVGGIFEACYVAGVVWFFVAKLP
jgi:hypothetical protein